PHFPASVSTVMFARLPIPGAWLSTTVTGKLASAVLSLTSVATAFFVVVPTAKKLPGAGVLTTEASSQLSVAVGLKLTAAPHLPASAFTSIFERAAITGAW